MIRHSFWGESFFSFLCHMHGQCHQPEKTEPAVVRDSWRAGAGRGCRRHSRGIALTKIKMHGTISRVRSGRWTASHTSCCSINCSSSGVLLPEEEFIASGGYEIGLWVFEREEIRCKT